MILVFISLSVLRMKSIVADFHGLPNIRFNPFLSVSKTTIYIRVDYSLVVFKGLD